MTNTSKIRVRFAPSPTGYLHIGGLRTALYNYLFAKKHGGTFILRIEDTDQSRFVPGAIESLIQSLDETGLTPDEGVFLKKNHGSGIRDQETKESKSYPGIIESGDFGPYIQSERLDIYKQYADELIASGKAYHCFCSAERLTEVREAQAKNKQAPKYDKYCLSLAADERKQKVTSGVPCVIRLNVLEEHGDVVFADLVRGEVRIRTQDIDDQVLVKSDGFPTYHLANVVDDHLMRISHVIRAEEWLPSTPKHILLYEAFGWEMPQFAHIPLLLNPDKSKLSKRQGDVSVEEYLKKGYLKEALINFIALLGWNPGQGSVQEIFSLDELVQAFDLGHVHKAGAVFDLQKLDWMNAEYIKRLPVDELYEKISTGGFLEKTLIAAAPEAMRSEEYLKRVLSIERERLAKLSDIGENNPFFFAAELSYDTGLLHWKGNAPDMTREALTKSEKILSDLNDLEWSKKEILEKILLEAAGERKGDLLWPLRVALTGAERSPSPFEIAWVLGKEESLKRLENSIKRLS
ncbi:MAG: glutamate--tRNA ligase [Candidatus Moranbacteria bacterium RIFCSPHIGHO2_12_FULL_54_9]|nr:MAG: glutamate--tRNA ligase [Candidatus Moranbacteria bacterium RIFCSPHIGHO2_01_FULL_54_31]OGI25278.1 MAG: glutamate--tRNA ligase [Candidatus Moranbacteria bacterium RIFCSPHIGHO2_12_FULL_54_9]